MYELFTDRARKSVQLAKQDAIKKNDGQVRPGHIIIGVLKCGENVATDILERLGVSIGMLLHTTEVILKKDKYDTDGEEPTHCVPTIDALERAISASMDLNHGYVGTEHVILGVLSTKEGKVIARENFFTFEDYQAQIVDIEKTIREKFSHGQHKDHPIAQLMDFLEEKVDDEDIEDIEDIEQSVHRLVEENKELRLILKGVRDSALGEESAGDCIRWIQEKLRDHPLLDDNAEDD